MLYTDKIARKTVYVYDSDKKPVDTLILIATNNSEFKIPFDSIDIDIFKRIESIALRKPEGVVYPVKRPEYKGFMIDPIFNR